MSDSPTISVPMPRPGCAPARRGLNLAPPLTAVSASLTFDGVDVLEIVAPDRYCAMLLLAHAEALFPAEPARPRVDRPVPSSGSRRLGYWLAAGSPRCVEGATAT